MPATQIYVRPSTDIDNKLKETFADNKDSKVILLLESSTDIETGDSWDESCCKVESMLEPLLDQAPESTMFMMVEVGNKDAWKEDSNMFKKHKVFQLKAIPTLLVLTSPESVAKRVEGPACLDKKVLSELFN
ncbi:unnamed protein product [Hymenolepis diminuta]|uniref:Thioredoxin domain-containing protein 17 n=1 Tax=Hymenolepis diminuta TaxID=6216 RepID=A0A0R3SFJ5_HYMDI|nr:unnamed protein product [Hymenolepis diminuta]VUZ48802.1 unnamed protein product [Hymenolepis diminuta]